MSYNRKQRTFINLSHRLQLGYIDVFNQEIQELQQNYISRVLRQTNLLHEYTRGKVWMAVNPTKLNLSYPEKSERYRHFIASTKFNFPCTIDTLCGKCYSRSMESRHRRMYTCINTEYLNKYLIESAKTANVNNKSKTIRNH